MLNRAMSLERTITDITSRLRRNDYPNEQAISQGVVLRLLQELGWDTFDTSVVWPEYQTGEGRADFALCYPPSKPAIVIEVKHVGRADGAVRQALQYAFHCGVPSVVLTDGRFWSFYLPAAQGDYEDRCICQADLFDQPADDVATTFHDYLSYGNVESGRALKMAQDEYDTRSKRSRVRASMPEVWREIVKDSKSRLVEILSDAVASKLGYEPDIDDVTEFLNARLMVAPAITQSARDRSNKPTEAPSRKPNRRNTSTVEPLTRERDGEATIDLTARSNTDRLIICRKGYQFKTAKEAMTTVLRELASRDPSFLERCARDPGTQGRKRRTIARTPQELYPHDKRFWRAHEQLPGGWVVATNLSNKGKRKLIDLAARLAGLELDKDIIVPF